MTVSREQFDAWRAPRFGSNNPTRLDNPLWASLVHDRIDAYQVAKRFGHERRRGDGATWCFQRMGQTTTTLDDGRTIYIAGEHEDYYDPDFYIYNDVVVVAADGAVAIYGYPRDAFPPTDFHTAALDGDRIWIVGSLGYPDDRVIGTTQVCRLELATMTIERLAATGASPGWIHKHEAELANGAIVVRGGLIDGGETLDENIDEWALDLATLVWTRRTKHDWQRWAVRRADQARSLVWELRQLKWQVDNPRFAGSVDYRDELVQKTGREPDVELVDALYRYAGVVVTERDYNVFAIELDGVIVRFTENSHRIAVIVEGRLADERLHALQQHVLEHLTALHATPWQLE